MKTARLPFLLGAALWSLCLTGGLLLSAPRSAQAQERRLVPMKLAAGPSQPFTEDVAAMAAYDRQIAAEIKAGKRPAPAPHRFVNNLLEEEYEKLHKRTVPSTPTRHFAKTPVLPGENPSHLFPAAARGGRAAASRGKTPLAPQARGIGFDGGFYTGWYPPDTQGVASPEHIVVVVNGGVFIHNKRSGILQRALSLNAFFRYQTGGRRLPLSDTFDPRILYDRRSKRFFATAMDFGDDGTGNHIYLAVSRTSNPLGVWDKYQIRIGEPDAFTDYSTLGVDDNGVYFGATLFDFFAFEVRPKIAAVPKAPLLAASPSLGDLFQINAPDMFSSPQPALNIDGTGGGRAYIVSSSPDVYANFHYRTIEWAGDVPSITPASTILPTPSYAAPQAVPALDSDTPINVGDDRVQMPLLRNNRLYATRAVFDLDWSVTAPEWLELDVTNPDATLLQIGRVIDDNLTYQFYYPSLAVSGQGHLALGFSGSYDGVPVGAFATGRLATDAANTTQGVMQIKAGRNPYERVDGAGRNRWGDYSYTAIDPDEDMTFWTIQEYAGFSNSWAVWVQRLLAPKPVVTVANVTADAGTVNVPLGVLGDGFFEPGPDFARHLKVEILGGIVNGVSNVRVQYNDPTSLSLLVDIAAAATNGPRRLRLINPDGQETVFTNAITVENGAEPIGVSRTLERTIYRGKPAIVLNLTVTNQISEILRNVVLVNALLGNAAPLPYNRLPIQVGTLLPGASRVVKIAYPTTVGNPGDTVTSNILLRYVHRPSDGTAEVTYTFPSVVDVTLP